MSKIIILAISLISTTAFADVTCTVSSGWSIQFNSGSQPKFVEAYQVLGDGSKSDAVTTLQQAYESPSEFKARVELDGQAVNIRTDLARRNGEYAIYTGTLTKNGADETVTCSQN